MSEQRGPAYRLVRAELPPAVPLTFDPSQRSVVDHPGGPLLVLAGPGTGKTATIVEAVAARLDSGVDPDDVLVLTFSRRAAAELRQRIGQRVTRTIREPLARTFHSYAYGLLRRAANLRGEPPPRLLTGAEQDLLVRELLAGDRAGEGILWPDDVREALTTNGFAGELRDLVLRCIERRIEPSQLRAWGRSHRRSEWIAAGDFLDQYLQVTALSGSSGVESRGYDPAELVRAAGDELRADPRRIGVAARPPRWVFVDEYQDVDPAQVDLLELLIGRHGNLVVVGDPDQSIYRFRGTDPEAIGGFVERFTPAERGTTPTIALSTCRRMGPGLLTASRRIARGLPGPGRHRELVAAANAAPGSVEVAVFASAGDEADYLAGQLRSAHLRDGTPWSGMAVLVRSTARSLPVLRRTLAAAGVPVTVSGDDLPLADQPAVAALLLFLRAALDPIFLDEPVAEALLTSPLGRADSVDLRRLRRGLRQRAREAGEAIGGFGPAGSEQPGVLATVLADPREALSIPEREAVAVERVGAALGAVRGALADSGTVEDALWALWNTSSLAAHWEQTSARGGPRGEVADRDLDAVLALFEAAGRFVDRLPLAPPLAFLDHVGAQQIPSEVGAPRATRGEAVRILTAHAAKGLEWDLVCVAGVQEGGWPDLRRRGSLLGSADLVDLATGLAAPIPDTGVAALAEERRLFYVAATRARRRLLVTAVDGKSRSDDVPSRFLDLLDPRDSGARRPVRTPARPSTLPALVIELRRTLEGSADAAARAGAAGALRRLADAGVAGADPRDWWGLVPLSDQRPLVDPDQPVPVSPSAIDRFLECPLRWLFQTAGATSADGLRQSVGIALHQIAERIGTGELAAEQAADVLTGLMAELDPSSGWVRRRNLEGAYDMLERFTRWLAANPRTLEAGEVSFRIESGRARVSGQADRLERDAEGRLVVVDLKTGSSKPSAADLRRHGQLGIYQLAIDEGAFGAGERSGGGALVQLKAGGMKPEQRQPPIAEDPEPTWVQDLLVQASAGMSADQFAAQVNSGCDRCPTRRSCPLHAQGQQVTR